MKIFKNLFGISSEEDEELEEREEKKPAPVTEIGSRTGRQRVDTAAPPSRLPDFTPPAGAAAGATPIDNVVATYRMNVVVIEPQSFDDAQQVAVNLQKKKPVVLNFEKTEKSVANRIIDFISGTTYALNGDIKKISNNVILCAPSNVNVSYSEDEHRLGDNMPFMDR